MWSAKGAFCVVVLCVAAIGVERAAAAEWVTVASSVDASSAVPPTPVMVELVSTPAVTADAAEAEAVDFSSLSMMEVGAHMDSEESILSRLSAQGTFRLSADSQEEIVAEALEQLEVEFIRDYGTDEDRDQLDQVLAEDREADAALEAGSMRFAHTEAGVQAERRRHRRSFGGFRGGRGGGAPRPGGGAPPPGAPAPGGGSPADIAAQCARMGFQRGNTSPAGLAQAAGPNNAAKMGGGFFNRLGQGLKNFAGKAGSWLQQRFGRQPGLPQPPAPGRPPVGPQPPAAGKGWLGRMFDKVKAGANAVGGFMNKWGNKAAGWGAGIAKFGQNVLGGNSKLGKFFGKVGGGMQKWGSTIGKWGANIQGWLNGKPVPANTKGAVIRPKNSPPPAPGTPGGAGGPKIVPGMPGTYKDKDGKWRGPDGRRVLTAKQQLRRKIKEEERKAARQARKDAREQRRLQRAAAREARRKAQEERDKKHLARHLEWRQKKLDEKEERLRKRNNRLDYSGIDPDFPGAGWRLHTPEEVEDCVTCRYVWLQVEMDIGNTQIEDNVYDSFNQNALEAMKQPIFYPGVQTMYDAIDDMIGDYMDGLNVNQICENSLMCRMPEN